MDVVSEPLALDAAAKLDQMEADEPVSVRLTATHTPPKSGWGHVPRGR